VTASAPASLSEVDRAALVERRIAQAARLELPPVTQKATGFTRAMRAAKGRTYVRTIGTFREPTWVVFDVLLPLLNVAAFVFVYLATISPGSPLREPMVIRVILGGAMVAFWSNVLWNMGAQFYWEKENGNLELYMLAPISRMSILLGMAVGSIIIISIRSVSAMLLGAVIFGVSFATDRPLELIGVFFLTLVALYGMGMMFASLFLMWGREAWHTSNLFQEPVFFLSGFYFPVQKLGPVIGAAAAIVPMTLGIDAMNQLLGGPAAAQFALMPVWAEIALIGALAVIYIVAAKLFLDYMETRAKREGTLTLQQQ
jgi:ABC-2 type transport system permease protein